MVEGTLSVQHCWASRNAKHDSLVGNAEKKYSADSQSAWDLYAAYSTYMLNSGPVSVLLDSSLKSRLVCMAPGLWQLRGTIYINRKGHAENTTLAHAEHLTSAHLYQIEVGQHILFFTTVQW